MSDDPDMITEREAAELINVSPAALRFWRYNGKAPPHYSLGGRTVRYERGEVIEWIASNRKAG